MDLKDYDFFLDNLIDKFKKEVKFRKDLFSEMKSFYKPENDKRESNIKAFLGSNQELKILPLKDIEEYQNTYNVKIPRLIVRVLTEIGSGGYMNSHFISNENKLHPPYILIENNFLNKCIETNIEPSVLEYGLSCFYNFETNKFNNKEVQKVYQSLGSLRDKYLVVLFGTGHSGSIVLNRNDNKRIVSVGVSGITNIPFNVEGEEYESPYYKYLGEENIDSSFCSVNNNWWLRIREDIIKMNS